MKFLQVDLCLVTLYTHHYVYVYVLGLKEIERRIASHVIDHVLETIIIDSISKGFQISLGFAVLHCQPELRGKKRKRFSQFDKAHARLLHEIQRHILNGDSLFSRQCFRRH